MRTNRSPLWPVLAATIGGFVVPVAAQQPPGRPTVVASNKLPNVPGKSLTAVLVRYAPGEASGSHHHAGRSVLVSPRVDLAR